jgi:hypothetical protein
MNCEKAQRDLILFLYDELSLEAEELLQQHLEDCAACRSAMERERAMHRLFDDMEAEVPAGLLVQCRNDLRSTIRAATPVGQISIWRRIWQLPAALGPALKPLGAVALVALGFFGARFTEFYSDGMMAPLGQSRAEGVVSRVRQVTPDPAGGVRIVLDETRQRVLRGDIDNNRIRQLLLSAATDPANPGLRVETMEILRKSADAEDVRQALLHALRNDTNAGVRLKAIEGLAAFAGDSATRKVLADVLLTDENPGVRTRAIDLLVQHKGIDTIGVLQESMRTESNNYIRLRMQRALREMNASVETF